MAPTLDDFIARFTDFGPGSAGWFDTLPEVPDDLLEEIERRVYARVPAAERTARLTWSQVKKPKPWMTAWIRTLAPNGPKLDLKRCAELGESPLLEVIDRLVLRETKKVDVEALEALFDGAAFARGSLKHLTLHPHRRSKSSELGRAVARRLGPTIESLDVNYAVLGGLIDAQVDFPRLRHLNVLNSSGADPSVVSRLVGWPPFGRLTSLAGGFDRTMVEALEKHPVRPPLQQLDVGAPLVLTLLPDLHDLLHLTTHADAGVLDALAEHPSVRLRTIELGGLYSDELADYFRSSKADDLESITLTITTRLRRACCEAMAASKARPTTVRLHEVIPEGGKALVESDFLAQTERLGAHRIEGAFVDALIERPPPKLAFLEAGIDPKDEDRLRAVFGKRAELHTSGKPEVLDFSLKFALSQLDKVNGTAHASAEGVESLQELWWEADNLAHDAFHNDVSGVSWRALRALDGLERARDLRTLVAPHSEIDSLEPVGDLPLHTINVAHNARLRSVAPLASSSTLCVLDVSHTAVRDLEPVRSIDSLQKLAAFGLDLDDTQIPALAELRKRGVEVKVAPAISEKVDALAYPAGESTSSDGAAVLREAGLPALADAWDRLGPDSRGDDGAPIAQRAFDALCGDREQRREVVLRLIEAGADIDAQSHGKAATLLSKSIDDPALFHRLLDLGADPNLPAASPPIDEAVKWGRKPEPDVVERLIEAGASMTPEAFREAAGLGHLKLVVHAVSQGLDANAGRPIERAARSGSTAVVRVLLDAGAAPSLGLPHAHTLEVYDQLVAAGASPQSRSVGGKTILEELAGFRPDDAGCEAVIEAAVRDGVPVTSTVLSSALERCRDGGLPFFQALADAGVVLEHVWYAWNEKKRAHRPRTLRDQRRYPELVAFAKERKIPTGASRIKAMLRPLAEHDGPLAPGDPLWRDVLALADLLPTPQRSAVVDVLPPWVAAEADRARKELDAPVCEALAALPPTHPAVLLALAEGLEGLTPSGRGILTLACEVWPGEGRKAFPSAVEGLLRAGAPVDVGFPRPLETYLQASSTAHTEVSAAAVEALMHPGSRTRAAYVWMTNALRSRVDDRERVLAAFDDPQDERFALRDITVAEYAQLGEVERTRRAARGQHWVTLTHALNQALQMDHPGVVEALLDLGASPNFHVSGTDPALYWARSGATIRRLVAAGAHVQAPSGSQLPWGHIIRYIGREPGLIDALDALLAAGVSLCDVEPMNGHTLEAQLRALDRDDVKAWLKRRG